MTVVQNWIFLQNIPPFIQMMNGLLKTDVDIDWLQEIIKNTSYESNKWETWKTASGFISDISFSLDTGTDVVFLKCDAQNPHNIVIETLSAVYSTKFLNPTSRA